MQYAFASGSSWQLTPLSGRVAPGTHLLVAEAQGAGGVQPLPAPDVDGAIAMSGSAGKVALATTVTSLSCGTTCAGTAAVRDFVGYGGANDSEGGAPAPGLTNTTAAARAQDGAIDTDVNAADFVTGTPTPTDAAGAGGGGAGGGDVPGLRIHDIQAAAHTSPYVGKRALSVPGIATAVGATQFCCRTAHPTHGQRPARGIDVYAGAKPTVAVGDSVTVTGTVSEFRPGGRGGASNLTTTELSAPQIKVAAHGLPVPPARVVGPGGRVPPKRAIETVAVTSTPRATSTRRVRHRLLGVTRRHAGRARRRPGRRPHQLLRRDSRRAAPLVGTHGARRHRGAER